MASKKNLPRADLQPTAKEWESFFGKTEEAHRRIAAGLKKWEDGFRLNPAITLSKMQSWIESLKTPAILKISFFALIADWERYYYERFGKKYDFSNLSIPDGPAEYSWIVCNHPGVSEKKILSGGKNPQQYLKRTQDSWNKVFFNEPHGRILNTNNTILEEPYIVRCRPNIEADEDLSFVSAYMIRRQMKYEVATFKERLLLGDFLWWKDRTILDKKTDTLCIDYWASCRYMPTHVGWRNSKIRIHFCDTTDSLREDRRARKVIC